MDQKTISILGCGWLGFPLACHLVEQGFCVKGSTTQTEKLTHLQQCNIKPFLLNVDLEGNLEGSAEFFNCDLLILNIPFKRSLRDPKQYFDQISSVVREIECTSCSYVIFASSTSVYPDNAGEVSESASFKPSNERAEILINTEQLLLNNKSFESTIIRFSGLYGGSRELGRFLSGKKTVRSGNSPVNLIHLEDCVQIISKLINEQKPGQIYNACSDFHPLRIDLYQKKAKELGIEPPEFDSESSSTSKVVLNQKLKKDLNYSFIHPDPMEQ